MRQATKVAIALAAAAAALGGATAAVDTSHARRAAAAQRPNIVVLETDDQTLESMKVMTRTKQLLGDEGVTFDNNFVSYSLCCPSRSTFLTGQYAHNHGVLSNAAPTGGYYKLDSSNTLPVWLQRAGYNTIHLGKYLNGYGTRNQTEVPPGWSEWHGGVDPTTYRFYNYTLNEDGRLTTYCANAQAACYQTDVYAQKAQEIIERRSAQPQPYFLWVAFLAPHAGGPPEAGDPPNIGTPVPAPRHRNAFASMPLPQPPSFNEADVSDKPAGIRERPLLRPARIAAIRENYQQRLESLLAVDEAVQKIVDTLRANGTLDKTLIIFTSDNGFFHGEHRVAAGKVLLYEPSIRVPLIVRGPGIPKGVHRSQLVANIDLAPTIVDAANAKPGRVMDGRSLFPLLHDGGREYGRDIVLENGTSNSQYSALRSMHFLYAEYTNGDRELYDLAKDPDELQSLHTDAAYAQIRTELARRLAGLRACKGAGCRVRVPATFRVLSKKRGAGGCLRAPLTLRVTGSTGMTRVSFTLRGRTIGTDSRAPFRVVVSKGRVPRGRSLARARVSAFGDRLVTLDQTIRVC